MTDMTITWREIKARYPHICDPVNRVVNSDRFAALPDLWEDQVWHVIEFTRLQLMAWATAGPCTETLAIVMDEDLVVCDITYAIMSSMEDGD